MRREKKAILIYFLLTIYTITCEILYMTKISQYINDLVVRTHLKATNSR